MPICPAPRGACDPPHPAACVCRDDLSRHGQYDPGADGLGLRPGRPLHRRGRPPVRLVARHLRRQLGRRGHLLLGRCRHRPAGAGSSQPKFDPQRTPRATHPDTGAQIDGVVIPRFQEMCEGLLRVARRFPRRYVGWDIVITPDSWTIIEANHIPMLSALQLHRPLLLDPRLRTFYEREGVLDMSG